MRSRTQYLMMVSSMCVIYVIVSTSAMPPNACLLNCMTDVLKCKRDESVGIIPEAPCCDTYTLCYYVCEPNAESKPTCSNTNGKRGSWNKRLAYPGSWNKRLAFPGSWNKRAPGSWNKRMASPGSWNK